MKEERKTAWMKLKEKMHKEINRRNKWIMFKIKPTPTETMVEKKNEIYISKRIENILFVFSKRPEGWIDLLSWYLWHKTFVGYLMPELYL